MRAERTECDTLAQMRAADPAPVEELRRQLGESELRQAMAAAALAAAATPTHRPSPVPLRRRGLALLGGFACLAAIALTLALIALPGGGGQPQYAAAAVEIAEANPRLLVTAPGWKVTRADQFEADQGEVVFGEGRHYLGVTWYPARFYERYLEDRAMVGPQEHSTLLGLGATTVHYGRQIYATILEPEGSVFVELRGQVGNRAGYDEVIDSLRRVGVDEWLAAMPASVVKPEDREEAVGVALRGVPLPPGFEAGGLEGSGDAVRDEYQFAVEVSGAVACGWVESWIAAKRAGDAATMQAAVEAMATWSEWPLLQGTEMRRGWAMNVKQAANRIAHDRLNYGPAGISVEADGTAYGYGPQWSLALGCDPRWRVPVDPNAPPSNRPPW